MRQRQRFAETVLRHKEEWPVGQAEQESGRGRRLKFDRARAWWSSLRAFPDWTRVERHAEPRTPQSTVTNGSGHLIKEIGPARLTQAAAGSLDHYALRAGTLLTKELRRKFARFSRFLHKRQHRIARTSALAGSRGREAGRDSPAAPLRYLHVPGFEYPPNCPDPLLAL